MRYNRSWTLRMKGTDSVMAKQTTYDNGTLYLNADQKVAILNFSKHYYSNTFELINSDEFLAVVKYYLTTVKHVANRNEFDNVEPDEYVRVIKAILTHDDENLPYDRSEILASVERLYTTYRQLLRVSTIDVANNKIITSEFRTIDNQFQNVVLRTYRGIEERLQGFSNHIYRQLDAGTNASMLLQHHDWPAPKGYESLKDVEFVDRVLLRPPLMMHTKSNKREGVFSAVPTNPVHQFAKDVKIGRWYCYPAQIGETLAYVYFNANDLVNGLSLSNLFQLAPHDVVEGHKPDVILFFGLSKTEGDVSHYYHDEENDLWVGEVPYNDKTTYFGYMKKMCLTLHNLRQIYHDKLPIHGSMVRIKFTNGLERNVVFFGDSGAGKSESLEALQEIAGDNIVELETIFDDMGSFTMTGDGKSVYAQGTETGAFVRLDDLSAAVAFDNMDRGVYLNPERSNARVIIPADQWDRVIMHHRIDMWVYANNYDSKIGLHRFPDEESAKKVFIAGKRKALGTTDEVGMSTTFFANPFGPVQEEKRTRPIIDKIFHTLFNKGVYVGEIYTHLGNDKSKAALHESAQQLLDTLLKDNSK